MRLELEKSQQESERRRVFLLARYYARFFNLQTNFVLLHGMTEIAKVENPKELQDERLKVTVRFQSQWSQIKLIEFEDKRNRALDRAILLIGLFNDKDENNIRQKKVDFAGRLHAKMLKPIAKSLHEQFKGVQVQVTPVESKVKDEESWLDTILFWR